MKYLLQLSILLVFWIVGILISSIIKPIIVIPGAIMGMVLIFIALTSGVLKEEAIKDVSDFLLNNIAFFFIPATIAVLDVVDVLRDSAIKLFAVAAISTIVTMAVTMIVTQTLTTRRNT